MRGNSVIRSFLLRRTPHLRSISSSSIINGTTPPQKSLDSPFPWIPPFSSSHFSSPSFLFRRTLCSSSDSSNISYIKSEKEYDSTIKTLQDESLPALFYFTAAWCGPCRFLSPVIEELSKMYPHVKTYKLDIDEEALGPTLSKLLISAVPTLHFFQDGKKVDEIVGADPVSLKNKMEEFYG